MEPTAFYLPAGDSRFESTPATAGPWSADAQHGGPLRAIEMRLTSGAFAGSGPGAAWMRPRIPLIEGEAPSPFQRAAIVADSGSGVSQGVDHRRWLAINVELTLSLHRDPDGEWV